jgi:hypothetical protein
MFCSQFPRVVWIPCCHATPPAVLRKGTMLQVADCRSHVNSGGCRGYFALERAYSAVRTTQPPIQSAPVASSPEFNSFDATKETRRFETGS